MSDLPNDAAAPAQPVPAVAPVIPAAATTLATPVVTINGSAAKGQLFSLATGSARFVGAILVTHGAMTQVQADSITPIIAQLIFGTALAVGGQLWAQAREWLSHQKIFAAALADPNSIVVK